LLFNIASNSIFFLFLGYPFLCVVFTITFYSIKDYFDIYFSNSKFEGTKCALILIFSISLLFVFYDYRYLLENWNYFLIPFFCLNIIILVLSLFMEETPLYLYVVKDVDVLINQLERIKGKHVEAGEKEVIYEEIKKILDSQKKANVSLLFENENGLRNFTIFYLVICTLTSLIIWGTMIIAVNFTYDTYYIVSKNFKQLHYCLLISALGPILGWFLSHYTKIQRKILILSHFILITVFLIIIPLNVNYTHIYSGVMLFFEFSLLVILMKFGWEIHQTVLHKKLTILFFFTFFTFGFISAMLINGLYFYNINAAVISLIVFSFSGFVLSFFLNKDIE